MKYCRYDKNLTPDKCRGCEKGCLDSKPVAYVNRSFEEAVENIENKIDSQRSETVKAKFEENIMNRFNRVN